MKRASRVSKVYEVRESPIHGRGLFATRHILARKRIIEYLGERIPPEEADGRYDDDQIDHPHILLFTVDKHTVIDGAVGGNDARFINHSCEPNCQAVNENGRIFFESIRDIPRGEELTYDYQLERAGRFRADWRERYRCCCGTPSCRGTMLAPPKKAEKKA
jgi:SET domain-containing protein